MCPSPIGISIQPLSDSTRVVGDFTSMLEASGTFTYTSDSCGTSGTWTAEPNYGTNGTVYALVQQSDGKVLVGGDFTTLRGYRHYGLGRLNTDGTLDTSFTPAVTGGEVEAIALQSDGKIIIGGDFSQVNGTDRDLIARLNTDGTPGYEF